MRISNNIADFNTYRSSNTATNTQSSSIEALSSGLRINKAGDEVTIDSVSKQRFELSTYQNTLENTGNTLNTSTENLTTAESRINDANAAKELMNLTKTSILIQAGSAMLGQANQQPQAVLQLLQ